MKLQQYNIYAILLFTFVMLTNSNNLLAKVRGFSKESISKNILSESPLIQIKKGFRNGYGHNSFLTLSPDGKWLTVQSRGADEIVVIDTDTREFRIIPLHDHGVSYARVIRNVLIISASYKKTDFHYYDLSKPKTTWKKLKVKPIKNLNNRDLSLYFPVLNHMKNAITRIMLFDPEKRQGGLYTLLSNFPRKNQPVSLRRDNKTIYLSKGWGKGIYEVANQPHSTAREILPESHNPSIGKTKAVENFLLFNDSNTSGIYAYNLESKTRHYAVRCYNWVTCSHPVFHPNDNRFYFLAEKDGEASSVFESRFDPTLNRLEVPKKGETWLACIENVDSRSSILSLKFQDYENQMFDINGREMICPIWESFSDSPEITVTMIQPRDGTHIILDSIKLKAIKMENGGDVCTQTNTAYFADNKFHKGRYRSADGKAGAQFFTPYQYHFTLE